jgi:predicted NACHT family NTPase
MFLDAVLENLMSDFTSNQTRDYAYVCACGEALNNILVMVLDAGFYKSLQQLKDQLPPPDQNRERLQNWLQENYATWIEQLKGTIANYRNIHHPWQFSPEQEQVLQRYYDANQLLIDCLNSNCEVTAATRQDIEATLLLPQQELDDREWKGD